MLSSFFDSENRGSIIVRNVGKFLPDHTSSFPEDVTLEHYIDMLRKYLQGAKSLSEGNSYSYSQEIPNILIENDDSLPFSQKPATGTYSELE